MDEKNETFEYTYSAEQQEEIERIRNKYLKKEDDKLEQLRQLDASVGKKGTAAGISVGLIGTLLFGGAMSMALVIGPDMIMESLMLGIPGIICMVAAYPLYKKVTAKERERIAPQILALTEEIHHS